MSATASKSWLAPFSVLGAEGVVADWCPKYFEVLGNPSAPTLILQKR